VRRCILATDIGEALIREPHNNDEIDAWMAEKLAAEQVMPHV
jgi:hypothetical protein